MRYALFLLSGLLLALFSCTPKAATGDAIGKVIEFNERMNMKPGETVMVEGQSGSVTFVEVMNDSRCPEGVTCIQAGEATVVVELANGIKQRAAIDADYKTARRIVSGDIVVNVLGLSPYPKEGKAISLNDYRLQVNVTPLKD